MALEDVNYASALYCTIYCNLESKVYSASIYSGSGEKGVEPEGKALHLLVDLHSLPHQSSQAVL